MIIQGYSNVQIFQAQARLLIEDERSTAIPGLQNDQNTYLRRSRAVLPDAVQDSQGPRPDATRRRGSCTSSTVPEFNGTKPAPPTPFSMLRAAKTRVLGLVNKTEPVPERGGAAERRNGR